MNSVIYSVTSSHRSEVARANELLATLKKREQALRERGLLTTEDAFRGKRLVRKHEAIEQAEATDPELATILNEGRKSRSKKAIFKVMTDAEHERWVKRKQLEMQRLEARKKAREEAQPQGKSQAEAKKTTKAKVATTAKKATTKATKKTPAKKTQPQQ